MDNIEYFNDIRLSEDYTEDAGVKQKIVNNINLWANSFGIKKYKNLGHKISILNINFLRVFTLSVNSQEEVRSVETITRRISDKKYNTPNVLNQQDIDIWKYEFAQPGRFMEEVNKLEIEGSHTIIECPDCLSGMSKCGMCGGTARIACINCKGTGLINCIQCSGTGKYMTHKSKEIRDSRGSLIKYHPAKYTNCVFCSTKGKVICPECDGSMSQSCYICHGSGKSKCDSCKGKGKLLKYFTIKQEHVFNSQTLYINANAIQVKFPDFLHTLDNATYNNVYSHMVAKLDPDAFKGIENFEYEYDYLLNELKKSSRPGKVHFQQTNINVLPVYIVDYKFKNDTYSLFFYGPDMQVHSEKSPFSQLYPTIYKKAEKFSKKKRMGAAIRAFENAYRLTDNKDHQREIRKKQQALYPKLQKAIRYGIQYGSLTAIYLILLWHISIYKVDHFWIKYFNELFDTSKASINFHKFNVPLTLLILFFIFRKKVFAFLKPFSSKVKATYFRYVLLGTSGGFAIVFITYLVLRIIDKIGILLYLDNIYIVFITFLNIIIKPFGII